MKKHLLALGFVVAGLGMTSSASAITLFTTPQFRAFQDEGAGLDFSATLLFDGFNASLGTLTSVHLQFTDVNESLTSQVYNYTGSIQSIGSPNPVLATQTSTATGPGGLTLINTLTTAGYTGTVDPGPNNLYSASLTNASSTETVINGTPTTLAAYIGGTNAVTIDFASAGTQGGSVPSGVFTGNDGTLSGNVKLWYDYDSTPTISEPTTLSLMGLGLVGFVAARRRKKESNVVRFHVA